MGTSQNQQQAVCKNEAIDLIICVARSPYDQGQCVSLFLAWHQCVMDKKVKNSVDEHTTEAVSRETKKNATKPA